MIGAVVLAAGQSRRMGRPKINLPWGNTTVLGVILNVLAETRIDDIVVVTGTVPVQGLTTAQRSIFRMAQNPQPDQMEMLISLQIGLKHLHPEVEAALVVLGDQPQLELSVVCALLAVYPQSNRKLLVPSYRMRRGHPWMIARSLWKDLLAIQPDGTLRQFLNQHSDEIDYVTVDTESILLDLDTPEDYDQYKPRSG